MACAALSQPSGASASSAEGIARSKRSSSRYSPITPVEKGSTLAAPTPDEAPTISQQRSASRRPRSAVPALALPAFTRKYRGAASARCRRATVTGAAQNRFRVNVAAQRDPGESSKSARSSRGSGRPPSAALPTRTPFTGAMNSISESPTAIVLFLFFLFPCPAQASRPQQRLYFLPEPQGQGSLRPTLRAALM